MPPKSIHMRVPFSTILTRAWSQCGQRSTIPAPRKTCAAPTGMAMPQLPQIMVAVVISTANTSPSMPATALPSSISSSMSVSRRPEPLGLDVLRLVAEVHQRLGHGLDEGCRAADVDVRPLLWARADLGQHAGVDAARVAGQPGGCD